MVATGLARLRSIDNRTADLRRFAGSRLERVALPYWKTIDLPPTHAWRPKDCAPIRRKTHRQFLAFLCADYADAATNHRQRHAANFGGRCGSSASVRRLSAWSLPPGFAKEPEARARIRRLRGIRRRIPTARRAELGDRCQRRSVPRMKRRRRTPLQLAAASVRRWLYRRHATGLDTRCFNIPLDNKVGLSYTLQARYCPLLTRWRNCGVGDCRSSNATARRRSGEVRTGRSVIAGRPPPWNLVSCPALLLTTITPSLPQAAAR